MRINRDYEEFGVQPTLEFSKYAFMEFQNDWSDVVALFKRENNWYTFRFAHLQVEKDDIVEGWDIDFVLLGLGFRLRITSGTLAEPLASALEEIENGTASFSSTEEFFKRLDEEDKEEDA